MEKAPEGVCVKNAPAVRTASAILAIVPALDEAGSIAAVVSELKSLGDPPDVLVIDDGSSDDTAQLALQAGAMILRLPYNCGIGATVQAGLAFAVAHDYEIVARFDGDGQHDPSALGRLRVPIDTGDADFVLGSRYVERLGFQSTWPRRLGSRWFGFLLRAVVGRRISDPTSGCWVANSRAARVLLSESSFDYPEVDCLVSLERASCRIVELPITMRERRAGRSSIEGLSVPYYMLKVSMAVLMARMRPDDSQSRQLFPKP